MRIEDRRFDENEIYAISGYDLNQLWAVSSRFMSMENLDAEQRRDLGKVLQFRLGMAEAIPEDLWRKNETT